MPTNEQEIRLTNIISWIRTAKECLPAINEGQSHLETAGPHQLGADRVAEMSALIDRLHRRAMALIARDQVAGPAVSDHRAA